MLHAGVLKKFGLYGLIRIALPLMPDALQYPILPSGLFSHLPFSFFPTFAQNWLLSLGWMHVLAFLCLGNIVYCGFVAMRQRDLNMLIGNSSVAHMGFCFLGIASLSLIGVTGAVTVMIAHGLLAALTFALSGYLYQQTGTLDMDKMGGLLRQIPFIGAALVMAAIAGCGLPGFANFPGEALVLFGSWKVFPLVTAFAVWGALVIGAIYMLRAVRNILHGPLVATPSEPRDTVSLWRKLPYALLLASLLLFGFVPSLLTDKIKPSAQAVVEMATGQTKVKKAEKVSTPAALQAAVK
jgi:NADH-quinone oxidoreductase subunit M